MKRNPNIPNPDKGKKPNKEKSFTKSRSFAQSEILKIPIKKQILNYLENHEEKFSCRELQEKIGIRETSINSPIRGLLRSDLVAYSIGKHRFSNRLVKKYFLLTDKNRTQLNLFDHGS
ncbi:hypothetical protein [Algoriphagus formosus]|uniref:ArsR family transcriptional regulator n=1 Tax=Algoriphagus formosus TaxID=2007308 RepID=A0A4R5VD84_9BACT|nr:hypothetical protein [Algoriphagus aquimaris]TDK49715.1 hypothetical protein E1898_02400 [Algoriphagus aquimaris]